VSRRILIIEDEREIARLVELHLRDGGFEVTVAHDATTGLAEARSRPPDLVILDLMLPDLDGLEVCRRLRKTTEYTPILMLTARSAEMDRVLGLEVGADDYIAKPFSVRELVARVRATFRRMDALASPSAKEDTPSIESGDLWIDIARRKVTVDGEPVHLTAKEFDLLLHFARHPGRVYTRSELLDLVWGYAHQGYEHTVNSHINRLRSKIEKDPARPAHILTVWGVGYRFSEPEEASDAARPA
jgi:DNA-binding response OmpR family regulator